MKESRKIHKTGEIAFSCPFPINDYPNILLAHGGGGRLMHQLIEDLFVPAFGNSLLNTRHDSTILNFDDTRLAFTTDSFVVSPLFFPGADIGKLAICGTVNDLAMSGASPLYMSVGFVIEEGLPVETLARITESMKTSAAEADVIVVTGDTKVVDRGKGDGVYINTSGIGIVKHDLNINTSSVRPDDAVILSGDIGRHGIAVMAAREGFELEGVVESDCAPLNEIVDDLMDEGIEVHCMRDLTRGGLASALVEISETAKLNVDVEEAAISVCDEVRGACEILGFDPLYVANEGRFIVVLPEKNVNSALKIMRSHAYSGRSCLIGRVREGGLGRVIIKSLIGTTRIVDMLSGEQLPRIC